MTIENDIYNDDEVFQEELSKVYDNEGIQELEDRQHQTMESKSILLKPIIVSTYNFVKERKRQKVKSCITRRDFFAFRQSPTRKFREY